MANDGIGRHGEEDGPGWYSDYHRFYGPTDNEDGYGDEYRRDFQHLDVSVPRFGTLSERPMEAPDGAIYIETDESASESGAVWRYEADTGEWIKQPVNVDQLSGVATHIVHSTTRLESTFDGTTLTDGDTVYIAQPDTPYRTSQWLDIDASDITVIGESAFAGNGEPLIKIADNANVGAFRIGYNSSGSPVSHVEIANIGHHGNSNNQDQAVKYLDGFGFFYANNCEIHNCYSTRASPYHEHGTGGSGISAYATTSYIDIYQNEVEDTGDRGIQVAGNYCSVYGNHVHNGYDRAVAGGCGHNDVPMDTADWFLVRDNTLHDNSAGSLIGVGNADQTAEKIVIANNQLYGEHRACVRVANNTSDIAILGNLAVQGTAADPNRGGVEIYGGSTNVKVSDNIIADQKNNGIYLGGQGAATATGIDNGQITDNIIHSPASTGVKINPDSTNLTIAFNDVVSAGDDAFYLKCDGVRAMGNHAEQCGGKAYKIGPANTTNNTNFYSFNTALNNDQNANSVGEFEINVVGHSFIGNVVMQRGGSASFDTFSNGADNVWMGNLAPDDGSAWALSTSGVGSFVGNRPNPAGEGFELQTPDGTAVYGVTVDNTGALTTTSR